MQDQPTLLSLTDEQQAIIHSTGNIKINAVAGSGKTTTIIQYAASRPKGSRILYLAFNKSVKLEAKKRFADMGLYNVQVETAHSLAYRHIVPARGYQVSQKELKTYELAEKLGLQSNGEKHGEYILANHILKFIAYFCNSSAARVQDLNYGDIVADKGAKSFVRKFYTAIEEGTRVLLGRMYHGTLEVTHDFYLKMFQLSNPVLPYDYILFDEGQDASPAMLDVFLKQTATKVIVGDTHQQIYGWRHAVNSLGKVPFADYHLSTSFRFCQDIADLSREVLSWKKHLQEMEPPFITGKGKPAPKGSKATIARTNLGLLLKAITYITEHRDVQALYFEGNIHSYTYADDGASLYDVLNLYNGRQDRVKDKLIGSMSSLEDLEDYIQKTEDVQLGMMLEIVREYENEIPSLIQTLKSKHVGDAEKEQAEMIFSTVHRSKGMEYDAVQLVEDFVTEGKLEKLNSEKKADEEIDVAKWNEEINLLYVAITRTKGSLRIPEALLPKNAPLSPRIQIIKAKKEEEEKKSPGAATPGQRAKSGWQKNKVRQQEEQASSYTEKRRLQKNTSGGWAPEADAELKKLYNKGMKLTAIAVHFKTTVKAVLTRLKKLGVVDFE